MSEVERVDCTGAPRDLGLDQGRAFRASIRREAARLRPDGAFARWFYERARSGRAVSVRRDTLRYFPHMGERTMGLARGSGVGQIALAGLLDRGFDGGGGGILALSSGGTGGSPLIVRALGERERQVMVRTSAPDTDYASVDLVLPWRVPALAGVNEHGLGVASIRLHGAPGDCAAPAVLMTQDCLQRFDLAEKAVDWLRSRPAGGAASFVLADATGALCALDLTEEGRSVREPEAGVIVAGNAQVRERLARVAPPGELPDTEELARRLPEPLAVLDPARRAFGCRVEREASLAWYESGKSAS